MNPGTIRTIPWEDELQFEDGDTSGENDDEFDLTAEDFEVMESMGWEPDDLPSYEDQHRYRRYLINKR